MTCQKTSDIHRIPIVHMTMTHFLLENLWIPQKSWAILVKFQCRLTLPNIKYSSGIFLGQIYWFKILFLIDHHLKIQIIRPLIDIITVSIPKIVDGIITLIPKLSVVYMIITGTQTCPPLEDRPSHGHLRCETIEEENSRICFIECEPGYSLISGQNNYLTCGPPTGFVWSHKRVNHASVLPSCTRTYNPSCTRTLQSCSSYFVSDPFN